MARGCPPVAKRAPGKLALEHVGFFGFGTSSDDDETPAPRTPSLLDTLLGTPTKPADEVDRLAALHTTSSARTSRAHPLDHLRQAANEAASLSANDRAAGGWRLDAAARLRAEPEVQTRDESETYGGFSPFTPPREAWRAYASPLNDSPGALRRDSPTSKARVTQVDGKRWGELRVFPG